MKITEMVEKYYFHDSSIDSVEYDPETHKATVLIDFCNWMQDDYSKDEAEKIVLKLVFSNVSSMSGEKPLFDVNMIFDCDAVDNGQAIEFFTERTDIATHSEEYITLRIVAEDVTVTPV